MKFRRLIIGYIAVLFSACLAMNGYAKGDKERVCPQIGKCNLKLYIIPTSTDDSKCRNPILATDEPKSTTDKSDSVPFETLKIAANIIFRNVDIDIIIPRGQRYTLPKDPVFFTESLNGEKGEKILKPSYLDMGIKISGKEDKLNINFLRNKAQRQEFFFGVYLEFPGVSECKVDPKVVNGQ
jgi:hypothetical protein